MLKEMNTTAQWYPQNEVILQSGRKVVVIDDVTHDVLSGKFLHKRHQLEEMDKKKWRSFICAECGGEKYVYNAPKNIFCSNRCARLKQLRDEIS
jgi:hypothetical protein